MPVAAPFASCEKQFFAKLATLGFAPTCIVDVGGSNASWSTAMCEVFPEARFELFEPLAGRRSDYDHILEWALRTHPNFRLHEIALGTTNGTTEFWNEEHGVGSSLLTKNAPQSQVVVVPIRRLDDALEGLFYASADKVRHAAEKLTLQSEKLKALSPLFPLKKGYAIVKDAKGKAVKTAAALAPGDRLSLQFAEGRAEAEVLGAGSGGAGGSADRKKNRPEAKGGAGPQQETLW
jgi:FkbM family methyltransferase